MQLWYRVWNLTLQFFSIFYTTCCCIIVWYCPWEKQSCPCAHFTLCHFGPKSLHRSQLGGSAVVFRTNCQKTLEENQGALTWNVAQQQLKFSKRKKKKKAKNTLTDTDAFAEDSYTCPFLFCNAQTESEQSDSLTLFFGNEKNI